MLRGVSAVLSQGVCGVQRRLLETNLRKHGGEVVALAARTEVGAVGGERVQYKKKKPLAAVFARQQQQQQQREAGAGKVALPSQVTHVVLSELIAQETGGDTAAMTAAVTTHAVALEEREEAEKCDEVPEVGGIKEESREERRRRALDTLQVETIPHDVKVVTTTWLSRCFDQGKRVMEQEGVSRRSQKRKRPSSAESTAAPEDGGEERKAGETESDCRTEVQQQHQAKKRKSNTPMTITSFFDSGSSTGDSSSSSSSSSSSTSSASGHDGSGRVDLDFHWQNVGNGTVTARFARRSPDVHLDPGKLLVLDFDGTVVRTRSGKRFAQNRNDWVMFSSRVAAVLRVKASQGYRIVFVSNQMGLAAEKRNAVPVEDVTARFEGAVRELGVDVDMFLVREDNLFRKPRPGIWCLLAHYLHHQQESNAGDGTGASVADWASISARVPEPPVDELLETWYGDASALGRVIDMDASVFVGDAAGRPAHKTYHPKKDFAATDLCFALNVDIDFQTPEQLFGNSTQPVHTDRSLAKLEWHPSRPTAATAAATATAASAAAGDGQQEIVLLVGPPSSGKSELSSTVFADYARANQDTLRTRDRCLAFAEKALTQSDRRSVVVDNTNRDAATRQHWVALAQRVGVPIRSVVLDVSKETCFHMNAFRVTNPHSADPRKIPAMVVHSFFKNFQVPRVEEGFTRVDHVAFSPTPRTHPGEDRLFFSYLR